MTVQTSTGKCNLCGSTLSKSGMTRHIQSCLRKAGSEKKSPRRGRKKASAFHIMAEGRYAPEYWMHLLVPADAMLEDLDTFLRQTWLECCGHLSEFTIEGESYSSSAHQESGMFFDPFDPSDDEEDEELTEEQIQQIMSDPDVPAPIKQMLQMSPEDVEKDPDKAMNMTRDALAAILGEVVTELEGKAKAEETEDNGPGKVISLDAYRAEPQPDMLRNALQQLSQANSEDVMKFLEQLGPPPGLSPFMDAPDGCMHVELGDVLEKGMRFRHEYDFGTTTELNLRVVSESEAEVSKNGSDIQVLSRNDPPGILCQECGKPAVVVCSMCAWAGQGWLCKRCSRKHDCQGDGPDEEMMLPVVNSPRVGMCGYDGE